MEPMVIKITFFLKKKAEISTAQFQHHYESSHVPLTQKYVGHLLKDYRRNYPLKALRDPSGTVAPAHLDYDAISEMWLQDDAALTEMSRIFNEPEINVILNEDQSHFLRREETLMVVCEERDTRAAAE
jgi:uncharacterized protein (TIGR02118 family)